VPFNETRFAETRELVSERHHRRTAARTGPSSRFGREIPIPRRSSLLFTSTALVIRGNKLPAENICVCPLAEEGDVDARGEAAKPRERSGFPARAHTARSRKAGLWRCGPDARTTGRGIRFFGAGPDRTAPALGAAESPRHGRRRPRKLARGRVDSLPGNVMWGRTQRRPGVRCACVPSPPCSVEREKGICAAAP
jgi:hypothetical protein